MEETVREGLTTRAVGEEGKADCGDWDKQG